MRLVFLGPPGAGKGTQAQRLGERLGVPRIATGDMLRQAVADGTQLGREAESYMERGDLVPDAVVTGIVGQRLAQPDVAAGFILDGYPRTLSQAHSLDAALKQSGVQLDMVVYLAVGAEEVVDRLAGRRVCGGCGATYHVRFDPPSAHGLCDSCASSLVQRPDDREATVRERLSVYQRLTSPLLDHYREQGLLQEVDGEGSLEEVYRRIELLATLPS